jgi:hypothetical protein
MEENNTTPFGGLDWYKAKTVEEMRADLVSMAQGNYFDNETEYVFKASGDIVIRTGEELNDQAPEGPGPEEYQQMNNEQIVQQYVSRIKMYPPLVSIEDQEGFAEAYLPALENMNNVASVFGNDVQYGDGMTMASEIQTGAITDYIATGFESIQEFYDWYLSDVAPHQAVLQPGQTQAEDFSIVDEGFYDEKKNLTDEFPMSEPFVDPMTTPNTRFVRSPATQTDNSLFKQPAKNYYGLLKLITNIQEGAEDFVKYKDRLKAGAFEGMGPTKEALARAGRLESEPPNTVFPQNEEAKSLLEMVKEIQGGNQIAD